MITSKSRASLAAGDHLAGHFWPSGSDEAAAGFISWSEADGVTIELVRDRDGPSWPPLGAGDQFVLHARTDAGDHLTVLDAWVRQVSAFSEVNLVAGSTLLLGEHTEPARRWPRAFYGAGHLNDWISETGLEKEDDADGIAIIWKQPSSHELRLPNARGGVTARTSSTWSRTAPHWSIEIEHNLSVDPSRPQTVSELNRRYAMPLLAFTAFVADRPDSLTVEVVFDEETNEHCEIWRRDSTVASRNRKPVYRFIIRPEDVRSLPRLLGRWYRLYEKVRPALDLFGGHIQEGNIYSPARFLGLYTAMEAYCRGRHGQSNFRRLRDYAGVPYEVHGCTNPALELIGQTRKYLAHLRHDGRFSDAELTDSVFASTRRASALMQCCLLRELGYGHRQTEWFINRHYATWPIPVID